MTSTHTDFFVFTHATYRMQDTKKKKRIEKKKNCSLANDSVQNRKEKCTKFVWINP
jgi:hypothetical protein